MKSINGNINNEQLNIYISNITDLGSKVHSLKNNCKSGKANKYIINNHNSNIVVGNHSWSNLWIKILLMSRLANIEF